MCDFAICQYCSKELNFSCLILEGMGGGGKILVNQDFRLLFSALQTSFQAGGGGM